MGLPELISAINAHAGPGRCASGSDPLSPEARSIAGGSSPVPFRGSSSTSRPTTVATDGKQPGEGDYLTFSCDTTVFDELRGRGAKVNPDEQPWKTFAFVEGPYRHRFPDPPEVGFLLKIPDVRSLYDSYLSSPSCAQSLRPGLPYWLSTEPSRQKTMSSTVGLSPLVASSPNSLRSNARARGSSCRLKLTAAYWRGFSKFWVAPSNVDREALMDIMTRNEFFTGENWLG